MCGKLHALPTQNSDTFAVKFSVFKNFASATVFNIKSPAFSISDAYRVLASGFQLPQEP